MTATELLLDLHALGVTVTIVGDTIRTKGPKGAVSAALTAALREHKQLLLAVARTIGDRDRDTDWAMLRDWALDHERKTIAADVAAAGRRVGFPAADLWPGAYARHVMGAMQVRALLRVLAIAPAVATVHEVRADNGKRAVA
jgi:hypothetical protein